MQLFSLHLLGFNLFVAGVEVLGEFFEGSGCFYLDLCSFFEKLLDLVCELDLGFEAGVEGL